MPITLGIALAGRIEGHAAGALPAAIRCAKLKKVTVITCGYLDGVFGWFSTFEHRQPHTAAFSKRARRRQIAIDDSSSVTVTGERV